MRQAESVQVLLRAARSRAGRFRRHSLKASVQRQSSKPPSRFGTRYALDCSASNPSSMSQTWSLTCVRLARAVTPKLKLSKLPTFGDAQIGRNDAQQAYDPQAFSPKPR